MAEHLVDHRADQLDHALGPGFVVMVEPVAEVLF
jgi:hypothetical protein